MARRRASSSSPSLKMVGGGAVVLAVLIGVYLSLSGSQDPYRTTSPFPVKDYLDNANSLRGNTYRLEAQVDSTLEVAPDSSRLLAVESAGDIIPLLVPSKLNGMNIERGQKLHFKVQINEKGLVVASDIRKP
jgi:hypothetical protein